MGLVDDDGVVGVEIGVGLGLRQQDAVGHQLEVGLGPATVLEADFHPHAGTDLGLQLLGHPGRHGAGREAPGLGMADQPRRPPAQFQADLGQLGGLAGAGLAADDDHLVVLDEGLDLLPPPVDRQVLRIFRLGQAPGPLGTGGAGAGQQGLVVGLGLVRIGAGLAGATAKGTQTGTILGQAVGKGRRGRTGEGHNQAAEKLQGGILAQGPPSLGRLSRNSTLDLPRQKWNLVGSNKLACQ